MMNNLMKTSIIILFLLVIIFISFQLMIGKDYESEVIFHTESKNITFFCNISDTSELRHQGLSGVTYLPSDRGMIFIYDLPTVKTYTMKNMQIPLDIIFINDQQKVIQIVEAEIGMENITSIGPVLYVVEINKGLSSKYDIKIGTSMDFIKI